MHSETEEYVAYVVRHIEVFERDPHALHEWAEARAEERKVLLCAVQFNRAERGARARPVVMPATVFC